jgi:predicted ATP-grasp superfamily ATP-dependent carboligase
LSFVRSLGRKGIPVLAFDSIPLPGTYSRYCSRVILPDVVGHEEDWLEFLTMLGGKLERRSAIIPTSDAHVLFVSRNRNRLSDYFDFSLPEESVLERITNKRTQYEFAAKCGIPIPKMHLPENVGEVTSLAPTLGYPSILKPYYSHLWRKYAEDKRGYSSKKLVEVSSPEELVQNYVEMEKSGVGILIQEVIPGGDEQFYGLLTYFGENSKPLAVFTKRKLRQTGMGYGDGSFQVSVWVPTVAELGIRLLKKMNYRGLAGIEFKKDPRDGQFRLIEINPRSVTGEMMAVKSGVDIPYIAYLDTIGERVEPNSSFLVETKWVSLEWDFKTFLAYRQRGMLDFSGWIKSLRGEKSYAIWSHDDPFPFIVLLTRIFRAGVRKVFRSLKMSRDV